MHGTSIPAMMKQKFWSASGCSKGMAAEGATGRATPGVALSLDALRALPRGVVVPRYERSGLRAGIVHIGVGNFHRAHQAVYLDDRFNANADLDWAIVGAGV